MPLKLRFILIVLFLANSLFAQDRNIPIGQWRLHTPYTKGLSLDIANNKIYISCGKGSMYLDRSDLSSHFLSKIEGLSDYSVNKIKYNKALDILILAYTNGNIDLIQNNTVSNISDIKRKIRPGTKNINHITLYGNYAYLSCDFGVSVVDLKKTEIKETYLDISNGGNPNKVYASAITADGDSIFIASDSGVLAAKISPVVNLLDFNNWHTFKSADGIPSGKINSVTILNNQVYAAKEDSGIYVFNGIYWKKTIIPLNPGSPIRSMSSSNGQLLICTENKILTFDGITCDSILSPQIAFPSEAMYDENGKLWIADLGLGLTSNVQGNFTNFIPNGPFSDFAFRLYYFNKTIIGLPGGYYDDYLSIGLNEGYYLFDSQFWYNYNKYNTPPIEAIENLDAAVYNPSDGSLYIASYGYGLIERKSDGTHVIYNDTLPLPGVCNFTENIPGLRLAGLAVDSKGDLWIANRHVGSGQPSLFVKRLNGTCDIFYFTPAQPISPTKIVIDDYDTKWVQLTQSNGMLVFNETISSNPKFLNTGIGQGNLPDEIVTCLAKDKNGQIWVGTIKGVAVFNDPSTVFSSSNFDASIPIFNQFPLLFDESIRCIKVDGANRKWIGTDNGLWLFNEDGTEVISHFTTENSPLLSNVIMDVEINEVTGEVFIATNQGIIGYRGTATESTDEFNEVKVFPNPVPPNYNGFVGISGLATGANVKITDIYGNLVYETKANGGTATWNVKDYNGRPADTGVYLIYTASAEGKKGFVAKVAVVK
jgi:ligand-binding sensor domain-containing protein